MKFDVTCSTYAAPSQLVQQTAEKAHGYGLPATTYFKQEFSNDNFHRLEAPCITTYQALFNGRSKFFGEAVGAIIFDDAHTAEHLLRDQYSLRIDRDNLSDLYSRIVGLFADYHRRVGKAASYKELETADSDQLFLVPPFELRRQYGEYVNLLSQGGLKDVTETKFAWAHLKDHLDVCAVVVDAKAVTVTPTGCASPESSVFPRRYSSRVFVCHSGGGRWLCPHLWEEA